MVYMYTAGYQLYKECKLWSIFLHKMKQVQKKTNVINIYNGIIQVKRQMMKTRPQAVYKSSSTWISITYRKVYLTLIEINKSLVATHT